jgi:hypothetical protein
VFNGRVVIEAKLGTMNAAHSRTKVPWFLAFVFLALAVYLLISGASVARSGTMEGISCKGFIGQLYCTIGLTVGQLFLGEAKAYLGYAALEIASGLVFLWGAWHFDHRFRRESRARSGA